MEKLAQLDMPENAYNWLVDFISGTHIVRGGEVKRSMLKHITASVIQWSGIGPAAYVVYAGALAAMISGNQLVKFSDDTYLVIPASSVDLRSAERQNVGTWAQTNNLTLNRDKMEEIIFVDKKRRRQVAPSLQLHEIFRVGSLRMLGVTWTNSLSRLSCHQFMHADSIRLKSYARTLSV